MKLKTIRLHPFGRLADESWNLEQPLVVIHGPNEQGKTTLRQAIFHALFTPTDQTKTQLGKTVEPWLPRPAGDHAAVTLEFEHDGGIWVLEKRWGADASSTLRLASSSTAFRDSAKVEEQLRAMLAHNEATFRHVLFTGQAELEQTLAAIDQNVAHLRDVRDLLKAGAGAAGDVDEQLLRRMLDKKIADAFGRWNDERGRPEQQNGQEKGLTNRWKRGSGQIVEAWYTWQDVVARHDQVVELERSIDAVNLEVAAQERILAEATRFVEQYGHLRNDLTERGQLEERLARLEGEARSLGEVFQRWPAAEAAITAWSQRQPEVVRSHQSLQTELADAQKQRDGEAIRRSFQAIQAAKKAWEQADEAAASLPDPGKERVALIDRLQVAITAAENKLAARTLTWRIETAVPGDVRVERGIEPAETLAVNHDGLAGSAEARVKVVAGGVTLSVESGDDDNEELFQSLVTGRRRLADELAACNAKTRDDVVVMAEKRRAADAAVKEKQAAFMGSLGGQPFAAWEAAVQALENLPKTRDIAAIESELERLRGQATKDELECAQHRTSLDAWREAYGDQEALGDKLLVAKGNIKAVKERLGSLAPLPKEFETFAALLARLDEAQRTQLHAQERLTETKTRRGELTTTLGDDRSQELAEEAEAAGRKFARARAEGRAYKRIREELDRITAEVEHDPLAAFGDRVAAIFSRITGGQATLEFSDNSQLPARVVRGPVSLPPERLSHGGGGALALAVRLGMAEAYLAQGGGFLMFDDPLVHFDTGRMAVAADVLRELSETVQVIVFTCHDHHAARFRGSLSDAHQSVE